MGSILEISPMYLKHKNEIHYEVKSQNNELTGWTRGTMTEPKTNSIPFYARSITEPGKVKLINPSSPNVERNSKQTVKITLLSIK